MIGPDLPWYTRLLGSEPEGEGFKRLVADFKLSSAEDSGASNRWYENERVGVSVFIGQGKIEAIQFYSAEHPNFNGFKGPLPLGLDFGMSREKVRELLGDPQSVTSSRSISKGLGHAGIDRYSVGAINVAVSYSTLSGQIQVLSFESKASG